MEESKQVTNDQGRSGGKDNGRVKKKGSNISNRVPEGVRTTPKSNVSSKKKGRQKKEPRNLEVESSVKVENHNEEALKSNSLSPDEFKEEEIIEEEEEEQDDWEANFADDGQCLSKEKYEKSNLDDDEQGLEQGVIDYLHIQPKTKTKPEVVLDIGEFGHVLEIYDFPSSYKSSDLGALMKAAGVTDYTLHWVDDTHAIAVFASQVAAHNALKVNMPFLQLRQVVDGVSQSRMKCKELKDEVLPYKKRPQTTSMVARNLVAGALGIRNNTTREQRAKDREMLKQAREEKRMKEKQRRDVWEED